MTPREQLIEDVARALYEADEPWHKAFSWEDGPADQVRREVYRDLASAVVPIIVERCAGICQESADSAREMLVAARKDGERVGAIFHNAEQAEAYHLRSQILALGSPSPTDRKEV